MAARPNIQKKKSNEVLVLKIPEIPSFLWLEHKIASKRQHSFHLLRVWKTFSRVLSIVNKTSAASVLNCPKGLHLQVRQHQEQFVIFPVIENSPESPS